MKKLFIFLIFWGPVAIWMIAIFYFSSRPRFDITERIGVDFIVFKSLHIIEYGFLFYLMFRALYKTTKLKKNESLALAVLATFLYAVTDEVHQHFVPTREGKLRDIFIDTVGIMFGWYFVKSHFSQITKYFFIKI